MCLHIFMQLWYDWNSHPSAGMMFFTASCRIVAWRFLEEVALHVCRSVALIRSTGSREIVIGHLCLWLVVLDLLMYLLCIINTHFGKQFSYWYFRFYSVTENSTLLDGFICKHFPVVLCIALWAGVVSFVFKVWHALFWHRWWPFFLTLMFLWIVYSELCHLCVNSYGVKIGVLQVVSEQVGLSGQFVVVVVVVRRFCVLFRLCVSNSLSAELQAGCGFGRFDYCE